MRNDPYLPDLLRRDPVPPAVITLGPGELGERPRQPAEQARALLGRDHLPLTDAEEVPADVVELGGADLLRVLMPRGP